MSFDEEYRDPHEECAAEIHRLTAMLEKAKGWRPIETAPENVSILIFVPNYEHYGHGVLRAIHVNMGTGRRWHCSGYAMGSDLPPYVKPTHWLPLPPPPVTQEQGG